MNASLEPLLPALHNLPIFFLVVVLLIALLGISAAARFARITGFPVDRWLQVAKRSTAMLTWVLLTFWLFVGAGTIAFVGALGGSLIIVIAGVVAFLIALPLLTTLLVAWSRGTPGQTG